MHGDFSFSNIKMQKHSTGIIDFEFVSQDPVVLDLAFICLTLIVRFGFKKELINEMLELCLQSYNNKTNKPIDRKALAYAILLRKFDSCCYHQTQLLAGAGTEEMAARQFAQMERLLALGWRSDIWL